jgi:hypothetical protein
MDNNLLDTELHTRFAIFLYALRLETAMLTKHVSLDAADAERLVTSLAGLSMLRSLLRIPYADSTSTSVH